MNSVSKIYTSANHKVENELSVLLGSIHRMKVPFELWVIDAGLSKQFKDKVKKWQVKKTVQVNYVFQDQSFYQGCYPARGRGCWLKLAGPRLLGEETQQLVYLDVDYILQSNLSELQTVDLNSNCFGACQAYQSNSSENEFWIEVDDDSRQRKLGGEKRFKPFNSGLMVIDVQKWLTEDVENRVMEVSRKNSHFFHGDQCILNALYGHQYKTLDPLYNIHPEVVYRENIDIEKVKGFHLMGFRPWNVPQHKDHICWYAFPLKWKIFKVLLNAIGSGPNHRIYFGIILHQKIAMKILFKGFVGKGLRKFMGRA